MYKYRFSIFTATYNRCNLLYDRYKELLNLDFKDFEWVVVSDGSNDDTAKVVESFVKEKKIPIQFINKDNGGKHTAWKVATAVFQGRYIICADDDDEILPSMLSIYHKHWLELENSDKYSEFWEIRTRCMTDNSKLIGSPLAHPYLDSDYNEVRYIYKCICDMNACRKVEVLRNEAAVPDSFIFEDKVSNYQEGLRWSQAARKYKTRFLPDITIMVHRTDNSLANKNNGKNRSAKRSYNLLVSSIYTLKSQRDLLLKYNKRRYFKVLMVLSYLSICLNEKTLQYVDKSIDKLLLNFFYFPMRLFQLIRK